MCAFGFMVQRGGYIPLSSRSDDAGQRISALTFHYRRTRLELSALFIFTRNVLKSFVFNAAIILKFSSAQLGEQYDDCYSVATGFSTDELFNDFNLLNPSSLREVVDW